MGPTASRGAHAAPVAVVVSGLTPPAWERRVLALLSDEPALAVFVVVGHPPARRPVRTLWRKAERRLFGAGPDALASGALDPGRGAAPAPPGALRVHLEGPPPLGSAPALWLAHGPDGREGQELDAACERAVAACAAGVRSEVRMRRADGREAVLGATVSGVRAATATVAPNEIRWKLAGLVARAVRAAVDGDPDRPALALPAADASAPARPRARRLATPPPLRWVRALSVRLRFRRPWRVCRRDDADGRAWTPLPDALQPPQDTVADPFLLERDGRLHLFVEHVPHGERLGLIAHADLSGSVPQLRPVLRAEHHLSYPFVLVHEDEALMIPETASAQRVELWRATRFPSEWVLDTVLMEDLRLADATLLDHDGRWWLFGAVAAPGASLLDELHLFHAPGPRGPWTAHPLNPVVSDARCARPAGPIQRDGPRLVRPGQDGSRRYGGAVALREITTLTPADYAERPAGRIEPAEVAGARAVHHVCRVGSTVVCDMRVRLPRNR